LETLKAPKSRGKAAKEYLEHIGLVAREQPIRSSDYRLVSDDPYHYYLTRRLGLSSPFAYVEALNRGTWLHRAFEQITSSTDDRRAYITHCLSQVTKELRAACHAAELPASALSSAIERERQDAFSTLAWFEAALRVNVPNLPSLALGLGHFWNQFTDLGSELLLSYCDPKHPGTTSTIQIDRLALDKQNRIWIVDLKSTSEPTTSRLQTCPFDFQTRHYMHVFSRLWASNELPESLLRLIPKGAAFGGMLHIALQKPSIVFGAKDRPYHYISEGKKKKRNGRIHHDAPSSTYTVHITHTETGEDSPPAPFKALSEALSHMHEETGKKPEKQFYGEPDLRHYTERCLDWFEGKGEYSDFAPTRLEHPVVNCSWTHASLLDGDTLKEYHEQVSRITRYAKAEPCPSNFPRTGRGMKRRNELTMLAPLYALPFNQWARFIRENHLSQKWRDDPI